MVRLLSFVLLLAATGCTSCHLVDLHTGDRFCYRYAPWEEPSVEEASARVRHWGYVGPRHYGTNHVLRLELRYYLDGTNLVRDTAYVFRCTGEKAPKEAP